MEGRNVPEEFKYLRKRAELLDTLDTEPLEKATLVAKMHYVRSTVNRALEKLVEATFVSHTPDGYVTTQVGQLCLRRHREFHSEGFSDDDVDFLEKRGELLSVMISEPHHKPALVEATEDSRSTINRGIAELEERGWVEKGPGGYRCTDQGQTAWSAYRSYVDDLWSIFDARKTLLAILPQRELPVEVVVDAREEHRDPRHLLFEVLSRELPTAVEYEAVLPTVADSRHIRLAHRHVVSRDLDTTIIGSASILARLREEFPYLVSELAASESVSAFANDPPGYGLLLLTQPDDSDAADRIILISYDDGIAGVVTTTDTDAVAWAAENCDHLADGGHSVTDSLTQSIATSEFSRVTGDRLPRELRAQGFVRLGETYFERNEALAPSTAYRAGVGLPEAKEGYVAERLDREGIPVSDRLLDDLAEGTDTTLLGPAGSGKSTVLKQVATRWHEQDHGTVLYRQSGRGKPLDAATLTSALDAMPGPVLVAAEDALRADANDVFQVMQAFSGDDSVRFLFDSRTSEWHDSDTVLTDARLEAFRREQVDTRYLPELDERSCARILERVEDVTGTSIVASPEELIDDDTSLAIGSEDVEQTTRPGGAFLFFYRLSVHLDPIGNDGSNVTRLGSHVDAVRADLDAMSDVALDIGIVVATLKASGLDVDPAYLYALSDDHREIRRAIDRLEEDVLFETPNLAGYDCLHTVWATEFLRRYYDAVGSREASRRFVNCLNDVLSLADDPERRSAVGDAVGVSPGLEQLREAPGEWTASVLRETTKLAKRQPKTAPLYEAFDDGIEVPDVATERKVNQCYRWIASGFNLIGRYEDAERFLECIRAVDPSANLERLHGLAATAYLRGDTREALELIDDGLSRTDEKSEMFGKFLRQRGAILRGLGRLDDAKATAKELRDYATRTDDLLLRTQAAKDLGTAAFLQGHTETARKHLEGALEEYESRQEPWRLANYLGDLALVELRSQNHEKARAYLKRVLELNRETGRVRELSTGLLNLGGVEQKLDNLDEALEYYDRSLKMAREHGHRRTEANVVDNMAMIAYDRGNLAEAREYADSAVEANRTIGDDRGVATALHSLGLIEWSRENHDEAQAKLEEALELDRAGGNLKGEIEDHKILALVGRSRGDSEMARRRFERAADLIDEIRNPGFGTGTWISWGAFEAHEGRLDRAEELFERSLDVLGDDDDGTDLALASGLLAAVRIERDGPNAGRERRSAAIDRLQEESDPEPLIKLYLHNARAEFHNGDSAIGHDLLNRARETNDEYGRSVPTIERQLEEIASR